MASFIQKYYLAIFIVFVFTIAGLSFYLGYQEGSRGVVSGDKQIVFSCPNSILDKERITGSIVSSSNLTASATADISSKDNVATSGQYMGSKNGTKYYTPGCPGSKRIKPENVIWFQDAEDATLQGYSRGSC